MGIENECRDRRMDITYLDMHQPCAPASHGYSLACTQFGRWYPHTMFGLVPWRFLGEFCGV